VHKPQNRKIYRLFYTVPAQDKMAYYLLLKELDTKFFSPAQDDNSDGMRAG